MDYVPALLEMFVVCLNDADRGAELNYIPIVAWLIRPGGVTPITPTFTPNAVVVSDGDNGFWVLDSPADTQRLDTEEEVRQYLKEKIRRD